MFGSKAVLLMGSLQSNLEVNSSFSSSMDFLTGSFGSAGTAVSSEFKGKAIFLPVLPGGTAAAALDEDFSKSTVFFSSSIDSLIGSFRVCFFFFLFLTASSSEDDDVESSDSKLDDGALFLFFFFLRVLSVSDSDSDDESDESESKGSERFFFFCFFCSNLSMSVNRL